jgi:hypothetical protein
VEALQVAVAHAQDAQQVSRTQTKYPFGWVLLARKFEALVTALEDMDGAARVPLKGSPFELVLIDGCLLYPFRYAEDATVAIGEARISDRMVSTRIKAMFGRFSPSAYEQGVLFGEEEDEEGEAEAAVLSAMMNALPPGTRLVLVAFACNEKAGLINAWWGEAGLADDYGRLNWHAQPEEIKLPSVPQPGDRVLALAGADGDRLAVRFDSGDMPSLVTGLRAPLDGRAAGEGEEPLGPEAAADERQ